MSLLELKTNLTSLKFGNDRPEGGDSGLPYIKTEMPPPNDYNLFRPTGPGFPLYKPGTTGNLDYPIRGGSASFKVGQTEYTLASQIDSVRIIKFLKDEPRGSTFITKQIGLQLSNPKIETGNASLGFSQDLSFPGILENTRVYNNGRNTIEQVRISGTGGHALRNGIAPFSLFGKFYYETVNQQNVNDQKNTNRLLNLNVLKMTTGSPFVNPDNVLNMNLINTLGISLNRNLIFQYLGGPGSTYGIGSTTIKRVVDTTKLGVSVKPSAGRNAMTYNQLKQQKTERQDVVVSDNENTTNVTFLNKTSYKLNDFRNSLEGLDGSYIPWRNQTVDRFYVSTGNYKDKMNLLKPFLFKNDTAPWEYKKEDTQDLIKFVFEAIDNDSPEYSTAIFFRAFLTAGITDNNSAALNPFRYLGRGENFYTYQGFDRTISFGFRIAAESKKELFPLYNKLNNLISQVYPDYSPNTKIMRAPLVRITVGDYLYRMPGFLDSVNVTVDNGTPWEINLDGDSAQLPQVVDVNISFKPILSELPRRSSVSYGSSTVETDLITITNTTATKNNPELIANNGSVIDTSDVQIIDRSLKVKNPQPINTTISNPNPIFAFNAAAAGRSRLAAQNEQQFQNVLQNKVANQNIDKTEINYSLD